MTTGVTCTVLVDGVRAADGSAGDDLLGPVVLDNLSVTWGRADTMTQPEPDSCSFEIMDQAGGDDFVATYQTGRRVDVIARGETYPDPSVPTFANPGFETATVTWSATGGTATRTTTRFKSGANSLRLQPTTAGVPASVILAPAAFQTAGTNPDAWDAIPTTAPGQTWATTVSLWLPAGASATVRAVLFTGPYATAGTPAGLQRTVVGDGTWQTVTAEQPVQALDRWVGLQVTLDPTGPSWDEMPPALTWDGVEASLSWDDEGSVFIDDAQVTSPPAGSGRGVLVFSGRITDLESSWDDSAGSPVVKVTATGFTADLQNRTIGDEPWPVESVAARSTRILDLAGLPITIDIDTPIDATLLSYRDVDAQGATGLLQEAAVSVDGVLWSAVHQTIGAYLRLEDPAQRSSLLKLHDNIGPAPVVQRTNRATTPQGNAFVTTTGTNLGWHNGRWFGSAPGAGTYTNVTNAVDGPAGTGITAYARKTWTVAPPNAGDDGFESNSWLGFTAGATYTVSGWIRTSVAHTNVGWDISAFDGTGQVQRSSFSTFPTSAGIWSRFSAAFTPTTGTTSLKFTLDVDGPPIPKAGETIDVTGLLVEAVGTVGATQRTNRHLNPSLGRNANNWSVSAGGGTWTTSTETAPGTTTGALPFGASNRWFKMLCTVTNTSSPLGVNTNPTTAGSTTGKVPVTAGLPYSFGLYAVSSINASASFRVEAYWYDSAGNVLSSSVGASTANTPLAWQRLTLQNQVAPAGAAYVTLAFRHSVGVGAFPVGGFIGATCAHVEQTAILPQYWDGSTVGNATTEYAWTGTPFNSSSVQRAATVGVLGTYFDGSTPDTTTEDYAWTGAANASTSTQSTVQTHLIVIVQADPDIGFDLSACVILRDPVTWVQDVSDVVTRASVGWLVQGVDDDGKTTTTDSTVHEIDAQLEVDYGTRRVAVSTQLQAEQDAIDVAQRILSRTSPEGWHADGLTIDDEDVAGTAEGIALVLDMLDGTSRIGAPIVLGELPAWTPSGSSAAVYLEGGTYSFVGGRWVLELLVSSPGGLGQSAAWDELDPVWTWNHWAPDITWNDLRGVAAP